MAITVLDREYEATTYLSGKSWVIDGDNQLHVTAENGNLASYAAGRWSKVSRTEDVPANPTSADAPTGNSEGVHVKFEANGVGIRTPNAYFGRNSPKLT